VTRIAERPDFRTAAIIERVCDFARSAADALQLIDAVAGETLILIFHLEAAITNLAPELLAEQCLNVGFVIHLGLCGQQPSGDTARRSQRMRFPRGSGGKVSPRARSG
jgi:hypothetical protein